MAYWEREPDPRLARLVERVCFSTDEGLPVPNTQRVVPDGCVDLIFSVEAVAPSDGGCPCRGWVFGTKTRPLAVRNASRVENVHLRLRPGAAHRLFGVSGRELTDAAVEVEQLWREGGRELERRVAAADDLAQRGEILQVALLGRLARARDDDRAAAVDVAVAAVLRTGGRIPVRRLAIECGMGERRLERLFDERVGVSPKLFARLARFRGACARLRRGEPQVDVALACGYFDQAHLLRDFRSFAGGPPSSLLASDPSNTPGLRSA